MPADREFRLQLFESAKAQPSRRSARARTSANSRSGIDVSAINENLGVAHEHVGLTV